MGAVGGFFLDGAFEGGGHHVLEKTAFLPAVQGDLSGHVDVHPAFEGCHAQNGPELLEMFTQLRGISMLHDPCRPPMRLADHVLLKQLLLPNGADLKPAEQLEIGLFHPDYGDLGVQPELSPEDYSQGILTEDFIITLVLSDYEEFLEPVEQQSRLQCVFTEGSSDGLVVQTNLRVQLQRQGPHSASSDAFDAGGALIQISNDFVVAQEDGSGDFNRDLTDGDVHPSLLQEVEVREEIALLEESATRRQFGEGEAVDFNHNYIYSHHLTPKQPSILSFHWDQNAMSDWQQFQEGGMYQSKLATSKQHRMDERNAARALQEESERLSNEFMRLFVGDSISHKHHNRRSAKLADWDDDHDRKRNILQQKTGQKMAMPTRYRLKRKKMHTVQSECGLEGELMKGGTVDSQNRPTFSISLLNPLMEENFRNKPSQKMRKMREKASSNLRNRFIQHLTLNNDGKTEQPQTRKTRVHSLNSQSYLPSNPCPAQKCLLHLDDHQLIQTRKQWSTVESESRSMESILRRKKRMEEILAERSKEKGVKQMTEMIEGPRSSKINGSKEFQKLRILLSLEKI